MRILLPSPIFRIRVESFRTEPGVVLRTGSKNTGTFEEEKLGAQELKRLGRKACLRPLFRFLCSGIGPWTVLVDVTYEGGFAIPEL